jgi:tetratricopeptide (TPR) repeat protein
MIGPYLQLGRYDEAIDAASRWATRGDEGWPLAWKAAVYARSGRAAKARQTLARLEPAARSRPDRYALLLIAYLATGKKEQSLVLLDRAYAEHSNAVVGIKVDPIYDPLRSDPRFKDFLRRIRLDR